MDTFDRITTDLAMAVQIQNSLLLALVRSHPNRQVLETTFKQALDRFPDAAALATAHPDKFVLAHAVLSSAHTAINTPL